MFNIYYYKHPMYTVGKEIINTVETEKEAHSLCIAYNQGGGYEDEDGNRHIVDYAKA